MARSEVIAPAERRALRRARFAYERAHVVAALRGLAIAATIAVFADFLHRTTSWTWLVALALGATLGALGWRGGAWKRGSLAGVLAGLPPLIAPMLVLGHRCPSCELGPTLPCLLTCFGTSSLVGLFVGHAASRDAAPLRYALAAIASAALTGGLGCGTTGLGGAVGVAVGLVAGSVAGWLVADRTAHA